ncbi:hypothetical protein HMPREF9406_1087 [Clostridium sp. HGF2]|nr:hypothetical protein HMPREF9406_1087 [Clostridium sp. HGF2]
MIRVFYPLSLSFLVLLSCKASLFPFQQGTVYIINALFVVG